LKIWHVSLEIRATAYRQRVGKRRGGGFAAVSSPKGSYVSPFINYVSRSRRAMAVVRDIDAAQPGVLNAFRSQMGFGVCLPWHFIE
jgi:hypothetical protein